MVHRQTLHKRKLVDVLFVVARMSLEEVTMAVVTARVPHTMRTASQFRNTLREAVTRWVTQTPHGQEAWESSCYDFNVGDLAQWHTHPSLCRVLTAHGIHRLRVQVYSSLDPLTAWTFDNLLVTPSADLTRAR